MSQANDLLNSLTETTPEEIVTGSNIVIGRDRFLVVPESLKKLGVQFDHDVETVTFDCPRFWDEWDLSKMKIYVNYMRVDGGLGSCLCKNIVVDSEDSEIVHFDWTVSGNVTVVEGGLSVLVCAKAVDSDGLEKTHWNSELNTDMYISKGMRCQETILRRYPDIITQLLLRMEHAEAEVTPDAIRSRINECLATEETTQETINAVAKAYLEQDITLAEVVGQTVDSYLAENPVEEKVDTTLTQSGIAADAAVTGARISEVMVVAKGRNQGISYLSYEEMISALNTMDAAELKRGQSIYIATVDVPDLWIFDVHEDSSEYTYVDDATFVTALKENVSLRIGHYSVAQLETQKVDLTGYCKVKLVESLPDFQEPDTLYLIRE